MKTIQFFIFSIFIFFAISLFGQKDSAAQISRYEVGVLGGVNYTTYKKDPYYSYTAQPGMAGGLVIQRNFSPHFAIRFGVQYQKRKELEAFYWVKRTYESDLICLPLTIRSFFGKKRIIYLDHGLRVDNWYKQVRTVQGYPSDEPNKSFRTDLDLLLGFGTRIKLSNQLDLNIGANALYKLNAKWIQNEYVYAANPEVKGFMFDFLAGINYKFKSKARSNPKKDSTQSHSRKVFVKIFYSPQATGNNSTGRAEFQDSYYGNSHTSYSYDSQMEISKFGQEFGIMFALLNRLHFNINTGIVYDQQGFQTKRGTINYDGWGDLLGNYSGSFKNSKLDCKLDFIGIPLIANYVFKVKKYSFYAGAGLEFKKIIHSSLSFNTGYGEKLYSYKFGQETSTGKVDPIDLFSIVNIGVEIPFSSKCSLFLEPNFKYELGKFNIPVNDYAVQLWSAGCRVGIKF
ncbi:MAG: outer membrane beta-barrel protein [Bacteroidia bacterium]